MMPHSHVRGLPLALLFALAVAAPSAATTASGVQVSLTAHRVTQDTNGKEILVAGDKAQPGEVVEYQALYTNENDGNVRQMVATLPIPKGMEYLPRTASPARVQASLDGRSFAPVPLRRTVRLSDGREVVREVPASEYRWLRWTIGDLAGHARQTVRARVRVSRSHPALAAATSR
jgi:hypothetical protein